jgi:hypothetical protein
MQMDAKKIRLLPEDRLDKLMFCTLGLAFAVSVYTSLGHANQFSNAWLINFVAQVVPAVDHVANQTRYVAAARVTTATQWLMAPFYAYALFMPRPPWKIIRPRNQKWRADVRSRARKTIFVAVILLWLMLADWELVVGPSFFRGTFWNPTINMSNLPYLGWLGLAISACFSPWLECFIYWLVAMIVGRIYIASFMHIENSADSR